jgi:hypothetical protein
MKAAFTNERLELLKQFQMSRKGKTSKQKLRNIRNSNYITKEGKIKLFGKSIYLYNSQNQYICEFYSINKTGNYLCCSSKTIKRAINKGYIYIPNLFIPYLNNSQIIEYNSIKNICNNELLQKLKSGLLLTKNKTKFIITYNNL